MSQGSEVEYTNNLSEQYLDLYTIAPFTNTFPISNERFKTCDDYKELVENELTAITTNSYNLQKYLQPNILPVYYNNNNSNSNSLTRIEHLYNVLSTSLDTSTNSITKEYEYKTVKASDIYSKSNTISTITNDDEINSKCSQSTGFFNILKNQQTNYTSNLTVNNNWDDSDGFPIEENENEAIINNYYPRNISSNYATIATSPLYNENIHSSSSLISKINETNENKLESSSNFPYYSKTNSEKFNELKDNLNFDSIFQSSSQILNKRNESLIISDSSRSFNEISGNNDLNKSQDLKYNLSAYKYVQSFTLPSSPIAKPVNEKPDLQIDEIRTDSSLDQFSQVDTYQLHPTTFFVVLKFNSHRDKFLKIIDKTPSYLRTSSNYKKYKIENGEYNCENNSEEEDNDNEYQFTSSSIPNSPRSEIYDIGPKLLPKPFTEEFKNLKFTKFKPLSELCKMECYKLPKNIKTNYEMDSKLKKLNSLYYPRRPKSENNDNIGEENQRNNVVSINSMLNSDVSTTTSTSTSTIMTVESSSSSATTVSTVSTATNSKSSKSKSNSKSKFTPKSKTNSKSKPKPNKDNKIAKKSDLKKDDRYYSRLNIYELSKILNLEKFNISLTRHIELSILEIFGNYCKFKLAYQTWAMSKMSKNLEELKPASTSIITSGEFIAKAILIKCLAKTAKVLYKSYKIQLESQPKEDLMDSYLNSLEWICYSMSTLYLNFGDNRIIKNFDKLFKLIIDTISQNQILNSLMFPFCIIVGYILIARY
ncbi:uncharacterized protein KGF55_003358 [Candida pseudojiufengensis]|uniref:uncharacterized protein n=1 Tax=Candida pseudojiufengensis TaxID=497109 RepID=UPI00222582BF|nr:uncharacterized protein KGF55_003358 [Candida pseudojiufengensis]KAI5962282.1 hypothetical protein KGF55_003358 [Candida pseudojiufengensis]